MQTACILKHVETPKDCYEGMMLGKRGSERPILLHKHVLHQQKNCKEKKGAPVTEAYHKHAKSCLNQPHEIV